MVTPVASEWPLTEVQQRSVRQPHRYDSAFVSDLPPVRSRSGSCASAGSVGLPLHAVIEEEEEEREHPTKQAMPDRPSVDAGVAIALHSPSPPIPDTVEFWEHFGIQPETEPEQQEQPPQRAKLEKKKSLSMGSEAWKRSIDFDEEDSDALDRSQRLIQRRAESITLSPDNEQIDVEFVEESFSAPLSASIDLAELNRFEPFVDTSFELEKEVEEIRKLSLNFELSMQQKPKQTVARTKSDTPRKTPISAIITAEPLPPSDTPKTTTERLQILNEDEVFEYFDSSDLSGGEGGLSTSGLANVSETLEDESPTYKEPIQATSWPMTKRDERELMAYETDAEPSTMVNGRSPVDATGQSTTAGILTEELNDSESRDERSGSFGSDRSGATSGPEEKEQQRKLSSESDRTESADSGKTSSFEEEPEEIESEGEERRIGEGVKGEQFKMEATGGASAPVEWANTNLIDRTEKEKEMMISYDRNRKGREKVEGGVEEEGESRVKTAALSALSTSGAATSARSADQLSEASGAAIDFSMERVRSVDKTTSSSSAASSATTRVEQPPPSPLASSSQAAALPTPPAYTAAANNVFQTDTTENEYPSALPTTAADQLAAEQSSANDDMASKKGGGFGGFGFGSLKSMVKSQTDNIAKKATELGASDLGSSLMSGLNAAASAGAQVTGAAAAAAADAVGPPPPGTQKPPTPAVPTAAPPGPPGPPAAAPDSSDPLAGLSEEERAQIMAVMASADQQLGAAPPTMKPPTFGQPLPPTQPSVPLAQQKPVLQPSAAPAAPPQPGLDGLSDEERAHILAVMAAADSDFGGPAMPPPTQKQPPQPAATPAPQKPATAPTPSATPAMPKATPSTAQTMPPSIPMPDLDGLTEEEKAQILAVMAQAEQFGEPGGGGFGFPPAAAQPPPVIKSQEIAQPSQQNQQQQQPQQKTSYESSSDSYYLSQQAGRRPSRESDRKLSAETRYEGHSSSSDVSKEHDDTGYSSQISATSSPYDDEQEGGSPGFEPASASMTKVLTGVFRSRYRFREDSKSK